VQRAGSRSLEHARLIIAGRPGVGPEKVSKGSDRAVHKPISCGQYEGSMRATLIAPSSPSSTVQPGGGGGDARDGQRGDRRALRLDEGASRPSRSPNRRRRAAAPARRQRWSTPRSQLAPGGRGPGPTPADDFGMASERPRLTGAGWTRDCAPGSRPRSAQGARTGTAWLARMRHEDAVRPTSFSAGHGRKRHGFGAATSTAMDGVRLPARAESYRRHAREPYSCALVDAPPAAPADRAELGAATVVE